MHDVFLSYAKKDEQIAQTIAQALKREGLDVWWDVDIPTGETFDSVIEKAIGNAKCVVVLWSEHSVISEWVHVEAAEGKKRNILIPVRIADVEIPLAFRRRQTADLIDWIVDKSNPSFERLVSDIRLIISKNENPENVLTRASELKPDKKVVKTKAPAKEQVRKSNSMKYFRNVGIAVLLAAFVYFIPTITKGVTEEFLEENSGNSQMVENNKSTGESTDLKIGDKYQGGIIFKLENNRKHGLVAAEKDLEGLYTFYEAEKIFTDLKLEGLSGWYWPDRGELQQLFVKRKIIGGFDGIDYWSSSEMDANLGWGMFFDVEVMTPNHGEKDLKGSVRPIRAF